MEDTLKLNLAKIKDSETLQNLAKELENKLTQTENKLMQYSQKENDFQNRIALLEDENNILRNTTRSDEGEELV